MTIALQTMAAKPASGKLKAGVICLLALVLPESILAQQKGVAEEPRILSVYPSAAQRGNKIKIELRGNGIAGAYALWTAGSGLTARVLRVEEVQDPHPLRVSPSESQTKRPAVHCAWAELDLPVTIKPGIYSLRLLSPRGLSNAVSFRVSDAPVVVEMPAPHASPLQPQVVQFPALIAGKLGKPGEVDYYAVRAEEGQSLFFEVLSAENFEPRLALFRSGSSWFSPERPVRVLSQEERSSDLMPIQARARYRVEQPGDYLFALSSLFGKGSPDCTYQLRIVPSSTGAEAAAPTPELWQERSFRRKLDSQWMEALVARSAGGSEQKLNKALDRAIDKKSELPPEISIPALIEGSIDRPGGENRYRFRVEAGQSLAFEIETPKTTTPHFNPRISVAASKGRQLFSNVHHRISLFNNNAEQEAYLKNIEPKAVYTFADAGEYVLTVRDMTARYGTDTYAYRVVVRPQVPHVGEISSPGIDRINLVRGKATRLVLTSLLEEGFNGDVTYTFSGLPPGVSALPAAQVTATERAPTDVGDNAEAVSPPSVTTAIMLLATEEVPVRTEPTTIQLYCRPVVNGVAGPSLLVRNIPLMVVNPQPKEKQ
jgi:hypothetical protein